MSNTTSCVGCGCEMGPQRRRMQYIRAHDGRGLCSTCYRYASRDETVERYERTFHTRDEVMDDWVVLQQQGYTRRQAAERLGMSHGAFLRAHERAAAAGDPRALPDVHLTEYWSRNVKRTGPDGITCDLVINRALMACERCGAAVSQGGCQVHHRKPRGSGGSSDPEINSPANLLLLCPTCHLQVERDRSVAYEQGWLVRREHDPEKTPVWLAGRGYCFLTPRGDIEEIEEID